MFWVINKTFFTDTETAWVKVSVQSAIDFIMKKDQSGYAEILEENVTISKLNKNFHLGIY